jgi:hypothetical protein
MAITVMNSTQELHILEKKYELVQVNGKYYIELEDFEGSDSIVQLSISLAAENEILRLRIKTLEKKVKLLETNLGIHF